LKKNNNDITVLIIGLDRIPKNAFGIYVQPLQKKLGLTDRWRDQKQKRINVTST